MRRVKQRQIRAEMPSASKNEVRRVRRGRELSKQAGQGHGKRSKVLMSRTNFPMGREKRDSIKKVFG